MRDKLLAQESHDFDISLSSLTGHIFALLLRQYLLSDEFATSKLARDPSSPFRKGSDASKELVGHITKIAANPEQSKNLETATANLAGLQLDFVNLRKEAYIGTSRIPVMQFGTALEDAERRDITINALFYNVHTRTVEDLTGMGLEDLQNGLIRTPLDPHRTFLDDPLRVLRCVRFASRFGYEVDSSIFSCLTGANGAGIRQALMTKVSRERFGMEIDKTMLGPDPSRGVELVEEMGLFDVVFGPPPSSLIRNAEPISDARVVWRAIALLEHIWSQALQDKIDDGSSSWNTLDQLAGERLLANKQIRAFLYYSALLLPLRSAEWQEKKDKWTWAGESVIFDGLKLGSKMREVMATMWRSAALFFRPTPTAFNWQESGEEYRGRQLPFLNILQTHAVSPRATRTMLLRSTLMRRPEIGVSADALLGANVLWSMVADLSTDETLWTPCHEYGSELRRQSRRDATSVLESAEARVHFDFFRQLKDERAFERVKERPLLNGKEVMKSTGIPPGNLVALVMSCVEAWQLDLDEEELKKDDCAERCMSWLHDEWKAGKLVPLERREELNAKKRAK